MECEKTVLMKLFSGKEWRRRYREQTCGLSGEKRAGRMERQLHTIMCEIDSCWEVATFNRQPRPVLFDDLEGLDGRRGERLKTEGVCVSL